MGIRNKHMKWILNAGFLCFRYSSLWLANKCDEWFGRPLQTSESLDGLVMNFYAHGLSLI